MELMKIFILTGYFLLVIVNAKQTRRRVRVRPLIGNITTRKFAPGFGKRNDHLHGVRLDLKHRLFPAFVLPLTSYSGYVRGHESYPGYLQGHELDKKTTSKDRLLSSDWNTNSDLFQDWNINLYPTSGYFYPQNIPTSERDTDYDYPETDGKILRGSKYMYQLFRKSPFSNSDKRFNEGLPSERISAFYNSPDKRLVGKMPSRRRYRV